MLQRYVLGSYSARKLGLQIDRQCRRRAQPRSCSPAPTISPACSSAWARGLLVTELMGQGVSLITGDYSRGASGFWVENGAIAYPVEEITIAANLRDMFADIAAVGRDVDHRSHILTGSILLDRMTVAGEG